MSAKSIIPAQAGWWTMSVTFEEGGEWSLGDEYEVLAWYISPIVCDLDGVSGFITLPVTIYGDLDDECAIARSPSGKWYSPAIPGSFGSLENIIARLKESYFGSEQRKKQEARNV